MSLSGADRLLNILQELQRHLGEGVMEDTVVREGEVTVIVKREALTDVMRLLRDIGPFEMLVDATAVDWLGKKEPRFEVVYHLLSLKGRLRLRIKVRVAEGDAWVPTVTGIYPSADPYEREIWDMFGIWIKGHPNLKRILTYEEFPGHPLRKDFPLFWRPGMSLKRPEERFEEW